MNTLSNGTLTLPIPLTAYWENEAEGWHARRSITPTITGSVIVQDSAVVWREVKIRNCYATRDEFLAIRDLIYGSPDSLTITWNDVEYSAMDGGQDAIPSSPVIKEISDPGSDTLYTFSINLLASKPENGP